MVDLQNDFLDRTGAYGRAGHTSDAIATLPEKVLPVVSAMRKVGGLVVSTQFTLVPGRGGQPLISPHLQKLRPFLGRGDFEPGAWGHELVAPLQPADFVIEKIAYSAFYMTRLEWVLKKCGITTLFVCGIVTNGGVASTVRDAHVRDFQTFIISDGCAAFSENTHATSIADLASIVPNSVITCLEAEALINDASAK